MCPYIPFWEPRKKWVEYEDGGFEPVNANENIRNKSRGPGKKDWWVVDQEPDWLPEKFADTRRGRKAKQELGTPKKEEPQSLFAPAKKKTTETLGRRPRHSARPKSARASKQRAPVSPRKRNRLNQCTAAALAAVSGRESARTWRKTAGSREA